MAAWRLRGVVAWRLRGMVAAWGCGCVGLRVRGVVAAWRGVWAFGASLYINYDGHVQSFDNYHDNDVWTDQRN